MAMSEAGIVYASSFPTTLRKALRGANCIEICSDHGRVPLYTKSQDETKSNIGTIVFYMEDEPGNYIDLTGIIDLDQTIEVAQVDGSAKVNFISLIVTNALSHGGKKTSQNVDSLETIIFTNKTVVPMRASDVE